MRTLLLITEKALTETTPNDWKNNAIGDFFVFTGYGKYYSKEQIKKKYQNIFKEITFFDNYEYNDLVEYVAVTNHLLYNFEQVVCLSEVDVMRSARIRDKLGLKGQSPSSAVLFRNKVKMKTLANSHGISTAKFKEITNVLDLYEFIDEVGYPIVIKPLEGRGSWNTHILKTEESLKEFLIAGGISKTHRLPNLLAEEYIGGEMYMIDALYINKTLDFISIGNCYTRPIEFLNDGYGSIYRLRESNPKFEKIKAFVENLVNVVFPSPPTSLYHIELFEKDEELYLCEIACRIGGVAINKEIKLIHGFDLKLRYINVMSNGNLIPEQIEPIKDKCSGWVVFPPSSKEIIDIKSDVKKINNLILAEVPEVMGEKKYDSAALTNCEVITFIFSVEDEDTAEDKIDELATWVEENVVWGN